MLARLQGYESASSPTAPIPGRRVLVPVGLSASSRSVAEECFDDAGDTDAGICVDGTEPVHQALPVDRPEQLALDVVGFVESVLVGRLQFDMERESSPGCRQGCDDHEREGRSERIWRAQY